MDWGFFVLFKVVIFYEIKYIYLSLGFSRSNQLKIEMFFKKIIHLKIFFRVPNTTL